MAANESTTVDGLSNAVQQLTKTQTKRVLLGLLGDLPTEGELTEVESLFLQKLTQHIHMVISEVTERCLSPLQEDAMQQGLEMVDSLLDGYQKSADKQLLSDATIKMNDLFVVLKARKEQRWQSELQQRMSRINSVRGKKNFPDPSLFNTNFQKRGWLEKRTRSFKGWKRRLVVLKGNTLTYFARADFVSMNPADWGAVLREGYLKKKKQGLLKKGKGWKQRWVQVRPEGLLYFKTQKDRDPIGIIVFSECERNDTLSELTIEIAYNGVKYFFQAETNEDFQAWAAAFPSRASEDKSETDMSYFTIRGVLDLTTSVLEEKQSEKPYTLSLSVEGGKNYIFAAETQKQKTEWIQLLGPLVKSDNSLVARKIRSNSANNLDRGVVSNGAGHFKQLSYDGSSGRSTPSSLSSSSSSTPPAGNTPTESPAQVRFAFKDEVIGRHLAVRQEGENFDEKFQREYYSEDEDDEEREEAEEAAQERTKLVRRETIKLIRTFKLEVHIEEQREIYTFAFDNSVLVDQVKSYLFKHIPALSGCNQNDYNLGVDADDLLTVEFLRFVSSNTFIEVAVRTCGIARVGLYLRDNLRKINDDRQQRSVKRPLKNTQELTFQAEQQRAELEKKLQQEKLLQEKAEQEQARADAEKGVQTEEKTFAAVSTQTEEEPASATQDKISWRGHTLPNSMNLVRKSGDSAVKSATISGPVTGITPTQPAEVKPKPMITKTHPRPPIAPMASVWQQVQPSISATKRPMIIPCEGWLIENLGDVPSFNHIKTWEFSINMDNTISETPEPFFYRKYFISAKKTVNYLGSDPKYGSISFAMCTNQDGFRGVLYTKLGTRQISVLPSALKGKSRKQQVAQFLMSKLEPNINPKNLRLSIHPDMPKELLSLEERQVCSGFKFGCVYVKSGQTDENDIFSNESGSDDWNDFLEILGTRIALKGWAQYNAGLDIKRDTTGTHSLYTNWKGNEVMFHVSTLLPYHPDDPQKLERKRHVGNDICVVIFQEGSTPYLASTITSHFNHIIAVVQYDKPANGYRLAFAYKDGVPPFGPVINPHVLIKKDELKEYLMTKLINGESASLLAPVFSAKMVRTREALLNYYLQQFL